MKPTLTLFAVALGAAGTLSCGSGVECGEGTIERGGECQPTSQLPTPAECGEFTHLEDGQCVPDFGPTVCDGESTEEIVDPETGVITCRGTGSVASCDDELSGCDPADAGNMTLCGQLYTIGDDVPFRAVGATGAQCDIAAPAASGPCATVIAAYDAIQFANNPAGATPLTVEETYIDDCGRFRLTNIEFGAAPFIGLGMDDHPALGAGVIRTTGTAVLSMGASVDRDVIGYLTPTTTDQAWTTSAGLIGDSFADRGVYVSIFRRAAVDGSEMGTPVPDVQLTRGVTVEPEFDYYFSDTNPLMRTTIDVALNATGANGTVLRTDSTLTQFSGTGGLPASCRWNSNNGAAIPTVVFVQTRNPGSADGITPCTFP